MINAVGCRPGDTFYYPCSTSGRKYILEYVGYAYDPEDFTNNRTFKVLDHTKNDDSEWVGSPLDVFPYIVFHTLKELEKMVMVVRGEKQIVPDGWRIVR